MKSPQVINPGGSSLAVENQSGNKLGSLCYALLICSRAVSATHGNRLLCSLFSSSHRLRCASASFLPASGLKVPCYFHLDLRLNRCPDGIEPVFSQSPFFPNRSSRSCAEARRTIKVRKTPNRCDFG